MQPYFKSRGYVPGGIVTNSKNESLHMEALPPFLRTLLVADGTVTKSLEAFFWEQIEVENLGQAPARLSEAAPWLNLAAGESVLERRVRLRGMESGRVYAYAQSLIKLEALPEHLRADLQQGRIGIGELLRGCHDPVAGGGEHAKRRAQRTGRGVYGIRLPGMRGAL